jgi:hypothetical protein
MLKDGVKDCRYGRFMAFAAIALFAGAGVSVAAVSCGFKCMGAAVPGRPLRFIVY